MRDVRSVQYLERNQSLSDAGTTRRCHMAHDHQVPKSNNLMVDLAMFEGRPDAEKISEQERAAAGFVRLGTLRGA